MTSKFLTENQAVRYTNCSRWKLREWRQREDNPLPFIQIDGKILYDKKTLDEWIRSHSQNAST